MLAAAKRETALRPAQLVEAGQASVRAMGRRGAGRGQTQVGLGTDDPPRVLRASGLDGCLHHARPPGGAENYRAGGLR